MLRHRRRVATRIVPANDTGGDWAAKLSNREMVTAVPRGWANTAILEVGMPVMFNAHLVRAMASRRRLSDGVLLLSP